MARAAPGTALLKRWSGRALQLALTVAVTWFIVDQVGLELGELGTVDWREWIPNPLLLVSASLVLLAGYAFSAWIWGLIVHRLGGRRLGVAESVQIYMIANLGRYLPGKVWQIAGVAALAKSRGIQARTATASVVLGQGIALVAASAVGLGTLLAGPDSYRRWGLIAGGVILTVIVLLAVPTVFRPLVHVWFRVADRSQEPAKLGMRHGLRWLALYGINWVMYALSFWLLSRSMGLAGALLPVASAFAAAYVIGFLMVFAPAGIGPREGFLIVFLTPHFGAAAASVVAVAARLWMTLTELLFTGVLWIQWVRSTPPLPAGVDAAGVDAGANP